VQERLRRLEGLDGIEIAGGERHHGGAQHGRGGAFVFARFRIDAIGHRHIGAALANARGEPLLVRRIGVGMQQRYRHRLGADARKRADQSIDFLLGEGLKHATLMVEPFAGLQASIVRHQRVELRRQVETVEVAPVLPADGERVGEAGGRDQRGARELALHDRVGDHGGAVDEVADRRPIKANRFERSQ